MADLGHTQAEWTRLQGREVGSVIFAPLRELRELADKFRRTREQAVVLRDVTGFLDTAVGMTSAGIDAGNDSTEAGRVHVRLTGNSGARVVSWYSATGATGLIAQGTAADGAPVTMAEQNSSGVTGTWELPGTAGNTTGDELFFDAHIDYSARLGLVFTEDGTVDDDKDSRDKIQAAYSAAANAIDAAKAEIRAAYSAIMVQGTRDNPVPRGQDFNDTGESVLVSDVEADDGSGGLVRTRTGMVYRQNSNMADDTTAGAQSVTLRDPAGAAASFSSKNDGLGSVSAHTPQEKCPAPSKLRFKCIAGVDTDDVGEEIFSVEHVVTKAGNEGSFANLPNLTVKKTYNGPRGIGPFTLSRTFSKTGDGSDVNFDADMSLFSTSGENSAVLDADKLHWKITEAGPFTISFYKDDTFAAASKVSEVTGIAAATAFSATGLLGVGGTTGSAPVENATGTLNLNPFKTQNSNGVADEFEIAYTVTNEGLTQTLIAEEFDGELNSAASGAETISDEFMKQGTFVPFAVLDN